MIRLLAALAVIVAPGCASLPDKPSQSADSRTAVQLLDKYANSGWTLVRPGSYNITGPLICVTPEQSDAADALVAELARRAALAQ